NPIIDSGVLTAALIMSVPNYETYLAHLQLDGQDIMAGAGWLNHMQAMIERHHAKRHYGGIGRDLSFGWAPLLNHVAFNITESLQGGGILRRPVDSRISTVD